MEQMTLGRRIAAHRKRLKLTQDALAQELGVSPQAVSKWENDQSCPDITTLPRLAEIFGITADELLGVPPRSTPEPEQEETHSAPGIHLETNDDNGINIEFSSPRNWSLTGAAWIISIGVMMLLGLALRVDVGFWSAAWITGLLVFGVRSLFHRVRFSGLAAALAGGYFLLDELELIQVRLGWNIIFPILIVALGVSLLLEGFGKKRPLLRFSTSGHRNTTRMEVTDGILNYSDSHGDHRFTVVTPLLKKGQINTSFGDQTIDFSGVEAVAPDCVIRVNSSFGDTTLLIPSRFRAEVTASKSFSDIEIHGHAREDAEGTLHIHANSSFGDLSIEYI